MSHLTCPKCRQAVSDDALDTGLCPYCGYDGAMVIGASSKSAWLIATMAVVGVGFALGAYLLFSPVDVPRQVPGHLTAVLNPVHVPPQIGNPTPPDIAPAPRPVVIGAKNDPKPAPFVVAPPKKNAWNPAPARLGPLEQINA